jgi:uncharacterized protein YdhG (YjbR/CyaY superfamily)
MQKATATAESVDDYIAAVPKEVQTRLKKIRGTIRKAAPKAEERISYRIPAYFQNGMLIFFAAFKNHIGIYPRGGEFKQELAKYAGGKGTIQIPHDEPLPLELIARIVKFRVEKTAAKAAGKIRKRKPTGDR